MRNRVEHQKQNQQTIGKWPFGMVFGVQLGLRQTQAQIRTKKNKFLKEEQLFFMFLLFFLVLIAASVCKEPSENKNETKRPLPNGQLVSFFGVQLDYS